MNLTEEQAAILDFEANVGANLQIVAYAGTGKSSTLGLIDHQMKPTPRLYLAFNKRNVEDMKEEKDGKTKLRPTTECKTLNSLGHSVWASCISSKAVINPKKTNELFKLCIAELYEGEDASEMWDYYDDIKAQYELCKAYGYIPEGTAKWEKRLTTRDNIPFEVPVFADELLDRMLHLSVMLAMQGNIDFNDQLYMSALYGSGWPRYPHIFIDEYQDLSPINHLMIEKLAKAGKSRLFGVGDPFQSIYAFRGAMTGGMAIAKEQFNYETRPLSVSFRCPEKIVANARWRAPGFRAFKSGGTVEALRGLAIADLPETATFISRNNAPLFSLAMRLISCGRSVSLAGTDIGPRLLNILRRLGDEEIPRSAVLVAIDEWEIKHEDSKSAPDTAACLRALACHESCRDLFTTIKWAEHLFKQKGGILLTTGHKAKGLEWERVYHLDPWLLGPDEQDLNLRYVIQTRSSDYYAEIESAAIADD